MSTDCTFLRNGVEDFTVTSYNEPSMLHWLKWDFKENLPERDTDKIGNGN